jgi:L-lactate dehydrogenase complex protein LldG
VDGGAQAGDADAGDEVMSDARAEIYARVRAALAVLPEKAPLPEYASDVVLSRGAGDVRTPGEAVARFRERIEAVRGHAFTDGEALGGWLVQRGATRGYCDPALVERVRAALGAFADRLSFETTLDRARIDDYQFGITRAAGAIAETGSLILDDTTTSRRLAALAPWIHVAVLSPAQIYPHVPAALAAMNEDPYIIFCTGPSKTADVEGILIEGVHGPGEQAALILD